MHLNPLGVTSRERPENHRCQTLKNSVPVGLVSKVLCPTKVHRRKTDYLSLVGRGLRWSRTRTRCAPYDPNETRGRDLWVSETTGRRPVTFGTSPPRSLTRVARKWSRPWGLGFETPLRSNVLQPRESSVWRTRGPRNVRRPVTFWSTLGERRSDPDVSTGSCPEVRSVLKD